MRNMLPRLACNDLFGVILGPKVSNDFDRTDNISIELCEFLRRNPQFFVRRRTDDLHWITFQKLGVDLKARDKTRAVVFGVPVASDLCRVIFVEHRIEDRLLRQPRWKLTKP